MNVDNSTSINIWSLAPPDDIGFAAKSNPTNGSGGSFKSDLTKKRAKKWLNPTNGSWWIVQIPPKPCFGGNEAGSEVSTNSGWWD